MKKSRSIKKGYFSPREIAMLYERYPRNICPELGRLYAIKGAITRQVNRINREAKETQ